ncbi:MAG TPA: 2-oxoglutarate and iron-dependent oxygenase domain-containing protein [Crinalium sp.]|jgi:isopenicillin N synthase-like dioxygenase
MEHSLPLQTQTKYLDRTDLSAQAANFDSIPIIDMDGLFSEHLSDRQQVAKALGDACRNVGFFYIINHRVSSAQIAEAYRVAKAFFSLPLQDKLRYHLSQSEHHRGYFGVGDLRADLHEQESFDVLEGYEIGLELTDDDRAHLSNSIVYGPNVWSTQPPDFKTVLCTYFDTMLSLGRSLFRGFALALDLPENYFDDKITRPMAQLSLMHYPPQQLPLNPKQIGVGAHTDYECFAILNQDAAGLQAQNNLGQWIEVPPIPGSFVVNIGDSMARWTNDLFAATIHRVINVTGTSRFSIPFFFGPNHDAMLACLESCHGAERPPKYAPIQAGEWTAANLSAVYTYINPSQKDATHLISSP